MIISLLRSFFKGENLKTGIRSHVRHLYRTAFSHNDSCHLLVELTENSENFSPKFEDKGGNFFFLKKKSNVGHRMRIE